MIMIRRRSESVDLGRAKMVMSPFSFILKVTGGRGWYTCRVFRCRRRCRRDVRGEIQLWIVY